jgi:hypothetical protein
VKSASERDRQTVTIGTALAVFVGTLLLCVPIMLIGAVTGLLEDYEAAFAWMPLVAVVACVLYLARHRRS